MVTAKEAAYMNSIGTAQGNGVTWAVGEGWTRLLVRKNAPGDWFASAPTVHSSLYGVGRTPRRAIADYIEQVEVRAITYIDAFNRLKSAVGSKK